MPCSKYLTTIFLYDRKMTSSVQLKIEDLSTIHDAVTTVAHKFLVFGSKISVPHHILAGIGKTNCDFDEKLYKVLEYRLKQLPLLTWHDIVRALRSPAVHEQVLASEIKSQYIPCSSSQAQPVNPQSSTKHLECEPISQQGDRAMHRKRRHSSPHEKGYKRQSQSLMPAPPTKRHFIQPHLSPPQPYSDSSSKPLFNQFVWYVKTLYRRSPVEKRTEVLKLQTPGKMFINLAFIDRKTKGLRTEYDEITEAMVRDGNADIIHGKKCPIDMNEIAANVPEETLEKIILVEGAPGVGKSTFAWEFCRRWERGEIAQQYDLVLLLRLRDKNISQAKGLKDLIYHHSEKVREAVVSELESCLEVNVLLLLEGYDELPNECRQSSLFLELINGQQLPFATLLITSRPWATCDVRRKFEHRIFQHIEVLGFTKEQVTAYIRSALSEEEALDLEERLRKQSTVRTCMYIPLNCAIVVTVYLECKANGVTLPTTLSGFYETVSFAILLRYLRAIDSSSEPFENFLTLPDVLKGKFHDLCQLAYDSIAGPGDQVKLIFTDLPKNFDGLGFTDSVFELYETRKTVASHNFLHLTFQEFLAAIHISNMEAEQ